MITNDPRYVSVETTLGDLLRERTGYEISELDRDATFMELGFDSLFLIQLSQQIKKRFSVKVSFRQLIEEIQTINTLVPHLASQQPELKQAATPAQPAASETVSRVTAAPPANPQPAPVAENQSSTNGQASTVPPASTPPVSNNGVHQSSPVEPVRATPVQPAPQPVAPSQPLPPMPFVASAPAADLGALEQIILQQNALMAQHLAILSGQPAASAPSPTATTPQVSTPAIQDHEPCSEPGSCADTSFNSNGAASSNGASTNGSAPQGVSAAVAEAAKPVTNRERFGPYKPVRKGQNNGLTDRQQAHLNTFMDRFTRKTAKSRQLAATHRSHFADPRGVAGYRRIWKSMVYQIAVEHSKGAHLRDIDGNRYVDIAMGFGLNLFGQSPDFVTKALHEQLERGVEVGPQSPIAGQVAKMLCEYSRKDRVTFCNTGSEAVMAALRIARTVTGKSKFVYFNKDYHGNFDQVLCRSTAVGKRRISSPAAPGVPQMFADNSVVLDYGTPEALQAIQDQADDIAAVLIEPVQSANPFLQPREFMHEVRRITKENNIAMIMDEVITGFRAAQGGAQEWFGVWGDMSTYGKILGGGMPIGALAGTREYMDALDGG
ncbi:MAG: aminotransferase class III-fold pyridoxal phosphate-dependent enzyme, partial [Planctomycetota bacterium]